MRIRHSINGLGRYRRRKVAESRSTLRPLLTGITFGVFFNREGYLVPERHTMERNSEDGNGDTDSRQKSVFIRLSDTDRLEGFSDGVFQ